MRKTKGDRVEYVTLPLPTTFKGRMAYTVDNLCSWRGSSVFEGCSWDWAQKRIREYSPPSRSAYLRSMAKWVIAWYLFGDAIEQFLHGRHFNLTIRHPVTSLPFLQQVLIALASANFSYTMNEISNAGPTSMALVGIFRLPPSSCPPVYTGHPFQSRSIAEFWSFRWQTFFRRSFLRLSLPAIWILNHIGTMRGRPFNPLTVSFIRNFVIFSISATIHVGVTYAMEPAPGQTLRILEPGQLSFFLAQPFGLLIEAVVINPITEGMPERWKGPVRRVFAWTFMIWTGRWLADWYALTGLFEEWSLPFSPIMMIVSGLERMRVTAGVI
ncbi:hypothetical protein FRB96_005248 [Tulasnella sp. 330]|nr:hypothetical protein FRB96_005248 [Tulasnella sp. 330]